MSQMIDQASPACAAASVTCFHFQHMIPVYVGAGKWEKGPRWTGQTTLLLKTLPETWERTTK